MNTFAELLRQHCIKNDLSAAAIVDMTGCRYFRACSIVQGQCKPDQIPFSEAVHIAKCLSIEIEDMANATGQ